MQHMKGTLYEKCVTGLTGAAWIAGLLIAGSDSMYMPWLNGMGLFVFTGASILMGKRLNQDLSKSTRPEYPRFSQTSGPGSVASFLFTARRCQQVVSPRSKAF